MKSLVALLLLATSCVPAFAANYAGPETVNFAALLPPPPAADSATTVVEINQVLELQKTRTPEQVARCVQIEGEDLWLFGSEVVGPWFNAANLAKTAAFFARVREDFVAVNRAAKDHYPRRRPSFVDPRVQPCVECKDTPAYPSGHGIQSSTWAVLLGAVFPKHAGDFLVRAATTRNFKAISGVHYPSDLAAGQAIGEAFGQALLKNPEVLKALADIREEVAAARPH